MPSLTYVATANAVRYIGAEPVFADVDPATWCLDPEAVAAAVTPRTRGIIAVHLYGHPADMDALGAVALWLTPVDHGGRCRGALRDLQGPARRLAGTHGDVFVLRKQAIHFGRGRRTDHGLGRAGGESEAPPRAGDGPGAAVLLPGHRLQLPADERARALCCALSSSAENPHGPPSRDLRPYRELLDGIPGFGFPAGGRVGEANAMALQRSRRRAPYGRSRDELAEALAKDGIETRPFFIPLHTLPPFRTSSASRGDRLPVTEALAAQGLNLPTYTQLGRADVVAVAEAIRRLMS